MLYCRSHGLRLTAVVRCLMSGQEAKTPPHVISEKIILKVQWRVEEGVLS